uniref:Uncharacterized protein n=1 Tax=Triticum urartu TaxID=4572 RepID=A0A8R7VGS7_TRIUA
MRCRSPAIPAQPRTTGSPVPLLTFFRGSLAWDLASYPGLFLSDMSRHLRASTTLASSSARSSSGSVAVPPSSDRELSHPAPSTLYCLLPRMQCTSCYAAVNGGGNYCSVECVFGAP